MFCVLQPGRAHVLGLVVVLFAHVLVGIMSCLVLHKGLAAAKVELTCPRQVSVQSPYSRSPLCLEHGYGIANQLSEQLRPCALLAVVWQSTCWST